MDFILIIFSIVCGAIGVKIVVPISPPEPWKAALMARYIIHESDWISIATISSQKAIKGYPYVSLESVSDGPKTNSSGVPYLYMTTRESPGKDVENDDRVTIMASLAQTDYCTTENYDPQDPRCAKVMISGRFRQVKKSFPEYQFALDSLFERHPVMKTWPKDHSFYVAKVDIKQIQVLDYFGGIKQVTPEDYYDTNITNIINHNMDFDNISVVVVTVN